MSDSYSQYPSPEQTGSSLDLGGSAWVPTQPAGSYVGPLSDDGYTPPAPDAPYSPPAGQPLPGYGQSSVPGYGQAAPGYGQAAPTYGQVAPTYGQSSVTGYGQPGYGQATPGYGQATPGYPGAYQDPGYQVYGPPAPVYAAQPYAYPAMMVPGQMIQTAYGPMVVGNKSRLAAGLLGIFLGWLGAGQFYRGNVILGIVQLIVSFVTFGFGALWGFIEGIVVLCSKPGSPYSLDSTGRLMT